MQYQVQIPRKIPAFIEVERDSYIDANSATAAHWKKAKKFARHRVKGRRTIHTMARFADVLGIPDDVPLLPRLLALASENVTALPSKRMNPILMS